jgi:PAS domain S-box-containing protein
MLIKRFAETVRPTGRESFLGDEEIIVSKTDPQGRIVYANDIFLRVAHMTEEQALGSPHCIVRHPDMPRSVFKLLWDTLSQKKEIFAFVNNMASNGDNYWVFAHVTPTLDGKGNITAYHSSRRKPTKEQVAKIAPLYATLMDVERPYGNPKEAAAAGLAAVSDLLKKNGVTYDEFIFTV